MVSAAFTYVHMRGRHHWSRSRARRLTLDLVLRGVIDPSMKHSCCNSRNGHVSLGDIITS